MQLLVNRTWRDTRVVAHTYGLRFDTNQTKQHGLQSVRTALLDGGGLARAFRRLADHEREPLIALQMCGGTMPLHEFCARFGDIRPHKPWRDRAARFFWKRPVSAAERLWYLGMIELQRGTSSVPDSVHLPDAVAALLPPPPRPQPVPTALPDVSAHTARAVFVRDAAALLGGLLAGEGRWRGGRFRWLTPRSLRQLNRRLHLPDDVTHIRSERRAGRLRFLHYVLDAAGFLRDGQPAPEAWLWLDAPDTWGRLRDAITTDLHKRDPLWSRYHLPPVTRRGWDALVALLDTLQPGQPYDRGSVYATLRFDLDRRTFNDLLPLLIWAGWLRVDSAQLTVTPPGMQPQTTTLSAHADALYLDLPSVPPLRPYMEISRWAAVESAGCLRVDADAVRHAVEHGDDAAAIIRLLCDLTGEPVPQPIAERIREWTQAAHTLSLRSLAVLSVTDEAVMQRIRADWRRLE